MCCPRWCEARAERVEEPAPRSQSILGMRRSREREPGGRRRGPEQTEGRCLLKRGAQAAVPYGSSPSMPSAVSTRSMRRTPSPLDRSVHRAETKGAASGGRRRVPWWMCLPSGSCICTRRARSRFDFLGHDLSVTGAVRFQEHSPALSESRTEQTTKAPLNPHCFVMPS